MAVAQQLDRRNSLFARHGNGALAGPNDDDDLDVLSKPILTRRKDFIDKEEEARKSPNRVLYFRRNADYDRLIEVCTRKLGDNPRNVRALLIRASSYYKKGKLWDMRGNRPFPPLAAAVTLTSDSPHGVCDMISNLL
jgi:hypothetical protein